MGVALLMIGTELTRGEILDTSSAWLADELSTAGFEVAVIEAVPDDTDVIVAALRRLASAHAFIVATGGLGPTTDDLTAAAVARALGVGLAADAPSLEAIRARVEARGASMSPLHEKQAYLPRGSRALPNAEGTAPGFSVRLAGATAFFMPGVPREMKAMFLASVLPALRPRPPLSTHLVRFGVYGLGESGVGLRLEGVEAACPGVTIGYRVHFPEVLVKVLGRAGTRDEARLLAERAASDVRERLGDLVYGEGDESFVQAVGRSLRARGFRLAVAESCTGGLVCDLLTSEPASDYFLGGAVTYANETKRQWLGVSEETLSACGAVSPEVAEQMARGVMAATGADAAVAVTGIAGPTGGSAEKPVGLCYWAVAHPGGVVVEHRVFPGDRSFIRLGVAYAALDRLRRVATPAPARSG